MVKPSSKLTKDLLKIYKKWYFGAQVICSAVTSAYFLGTTCGDITWIAVTLNMLRTLTKYDFRPYPVSKLLYINCYNAWKSVIIKLTILSNIRDAQAKRQNLNFQNKWKRYGGHVLLSVSTAISVSWLSLILQTALSVERHFFKVSWRFR